MVKQVPAALTFDVKIVSSVIEPQLDILRPNVIVFDSLTFSDVELLWPDFEALTWCGVKNVTFPAS